MKQYEIVNPSDQCTIEAESPGIAIAAVVLLAQELYGLQDEDGTVVMPVFVADPNTLSAWLESKGIDFHPFILDHYLEVADALDSVLYGDFNARAEYECAVAKCDSAEWKSGYRAGWEESRRTSLTTICKTAWKLAKTLREGGARHE